MPELSIPFAIGETVWRATHGAEPQREPCPECAGTKALTLIRGNGEQVSLDCNYCQIGYDPPRGYVEHNRYHYTPEQFVCRRVTGISHGEVEYSDAPASALFRDKDACAVRCEELNEQRSKEDAARRLANLSSKRHSLAHSVHYWGRQVKELQRDLEVAQAKLAVCPKPKKENPDGTSL